MNRNSCHIPQTFTHTNILSTEELLCSSELCQEILKEFDTGLCSKLEYLRYLYQKKMPLPAWYLLEKNQKIIGATAFNPFTFFLPFMLGAKRLFSIKMCGVKLEKPFLDLNHEVFMKLSPQDILEYYKSDIFVIHCIPTHYIDDFRNVKLMRGVIRYLGRPPYNHYIIPLKGSFKDYCAKFKSKGYKLNRKVRRFEKNCKLKMIVKQYNKVKYLNEFLRYASLISRKSYQHRLNKDGLNLTEPFIEYTTFLAAHGYFKSYILFDGATPVAYLFGTLIDGLYTAQKTGYDPEYKRLSPGTVLWFKAIENLFSDENAFTFDLTAGETRFKKYFGSQNIQCTHLYYLRKSFLNCIFVLTHLFYINFKHLIKKICIPQPRPFS